MNISTWSDARIMQLPDHLFGQRWLVSVMRTPNNPVDRWDISEIPLPDAFVMWEFAYGSSAVFGAEIGFRFAYGDQIPVNAAAFSEFEPVMPGLGVTGQEPRTITHEDGPHDIRIPMRKLVRPGGRRLIMEVPFAGGGDMRCWGRMVISSLPREVPDWFLVSRA